jgi:protocatechuate 3,4-dioxygenase beta subunit
VTDFRVVLNKKTYLEGRVLGENGKPVAKAKVIADHPYIWAGDYPSFDRETATVTDENGRYRMHVFPEVYTVSVVSEGQGVERVKDIEVLKNQGQMLDLRLHRGVHFKAKVLDSETQEPVAGFVLYHRTNSQARGESNAQGLIEIPNSLPGDEEFQVGGGTPVMAHGYFKSRTEPFGSWWSPDAKKPWHRTKTTEAGIMFDLAVGMPPVTIFVEAGVLVSGKVTDPDGHPVAQATVAPARTGTGNSLTGDTRYSVETKEDGTYAVVLPSSGEGKYNLMAHDGSYSKWRKFAAGVTDPIQTKPGQRIENLDIQLHRPAAVRGQVKATDGRRVGGASTRSRQTREPVLRSDNKDP